MQINQKLKHLFFRLVLIISRIVGDCRDKLLALYDKRFAHDTYALIKGTCLPLSSIYAWFLRRSMLAKLIIIIPLLAIPVLVIIPIGMVLYLAAAFSIWLFFIFLPMLWRKYVLRKFPFLKLQAAFQLKHRTALGTLTPLLIYFFMSFIGLILLFAISLWVGLRGHVLIITACITVIIYIFITRLINTSRLYSCAAVIIIFLYLIAIITYFSREVRSRGEHFSAIVKHIEPIYERCKATPINKKPYIHGKVVVWDTIGNKEYFTTADLWRSHIPLLLRATPSDANITIFAIYIDDPNTRGIQPGPDARPCISIGTFYWPALDTAGLTVVTNLSMEQLREDELQRDYIADWIRELPVIHP